MRKDQRHPGVHLRFTRAAGVDGQRPSPVAHLIPGSRLDISGKGSVNAMGDLRNKLRKEEAAAETRRKRARYAVPAGQPFNPECAGCGLKGLNNPSPNGFVRMYAASGGWQEPGKFYCENCLKAHTGEKPHGL